MYRNYFYRSPWQELEQFQKEMNRLFNIYFPSRLHTAPAYPAINVWTNNEGAIVTAEVPGCNLDDIDISVVGETLTIKGERKPDQVPEGARYHRRERGCGSFTRTFQLPFPIEIGKVEAVFDKGVLNITLPRAEADKPKKIAIRAA